MLVLKHKLRKEGPVKRVVAIPLSDAEPWAFLLQKKFDSLSPGEPLLDMSRRTIEKKIRAARFYEDLQREHEALTEQRNPLRHYRIEDSIEFYSFLPYELHQYFGWSFVSPGMITAGAAGAAASYTFLQWNIYFKKLLKGLPRKTAPPDTDIGKEVMTV